MSPLTITYPHHVDLYGFPHALLDAVLNPHSVSNHHTGALVENAVKRGTIPPAQDMVQALRGMSLAEENYLLCCYVVWCDEAQFNAALETTRLPAELCLASRNSQPEEGLPEDRYDTFNFSPRDLRKKALELRIAGLTSQEQLYRDELARLSVPRVAVPAD